VRQRCKSEGRKITDWEDEELDDWFDEMKADLKAQSTTNKRRTKNKKTLLASAKLKK